MRFTSLIPLLSAVIAAPSMGGSLDARSVLDDTYIVVFEKGLSTPNDIVNNVAQSIKKLGATINWEYHTVIRGFSVSGSRDAMANLQRLNDAEFPFVIEKDQEIKLP